MKVLLLLAVAFATGHGVALKSGETNGLLCEACQLGVSELDNILKENSTVARINSTLQSICKDIPDVASECEEIVNKYLPILLHVLATMSPQDVCSDLDLCSSSFGRSRGQLIIKKMFGSNGIACDLCEFGISEVQKVLNDSSIQEKIEDGLKDICAIFPEATQSQCDDLIDEYLPQFFGIMEDLDASQICEYIGLCSGNAFILKGKVFADSQRL